MPEHHAPVNRQILPVPERFRRRRGRKLQARAGAEPQSRAWGCRRRAAQRVDVPQCACGSAHSRQAKMQLPNPNGVVEQSPGVARRQPWVIARQCPTTPTGLWPDGRKTARLRPTPYTTPLGLGAAPSPPPRVVPSVQPWALLHNRVAVEAARASLGLKCRKLSSSASQRHSIPVCSPGNLSQTPMRRCRDRGMRVARTSPAAKTPAP